MVIRITRIAGNKMKAEIEGFEIISGRVDENTPPEGPSPGDIMIASLGMCAGVYAASYLKRHNISDEGLTVEVETQESKEPTRVSKFTVKVKVKADLSPEARTGPLASVTRCYVGNTLKGNPEIKYELE